MQLAHFLFSELLLENKDQESTNRVNKIPKSVSYRHPHPQLNYLRGYKKNPPITLDKPNTIIFLIQMISVQMIADVIK